LRVTPWSTIRKERRLPLAGEVMVAKGDSVEAEQVVARTELPGNVQPVKAASILGQHQQDLLDYMLMKDGEPVKKGEPIATATSFFGLFKTHCFSPCDGTVESVSTVTGQVIIREPPIPVEVEAYIDGTVVEVIPKEGVIVETAGAFVQGIFGIGGEVHGKIHMAVSSPDQELAEKHLEGDVAGTVLVGGSKVNETVMRKAAEKGVRAVVVGGIDARDLRSFLGYDLGVAITGSEQLGITLVVTEGFGTMTMAARTFNLLGRFEGKNCSVNGATQIRAGVMRPEIVISLAEDEVQEGEKTFSMSQGLQVGSPVRVIRAPHFGGLGEVTDLPPQLQVVDSGAKVRILKVRFADGQEAMIPRANVEMIER
jgi:phosphatidylserine decarboxylase